MSTYTQPSGSAADDASARPTAVVGQVPEADRTTAVFGRAPDPTAPTAHQPGSQPGYPPGPEHAPYGQIPYGAPGYGAPGRPPTGALPYAGYGTPPPAPKKRGWIGWLVGGIAVVLVAGIVAAYLLLSGGGTLIGVSTDQVAIPDASTTGVTDGVVLDGSGTVQNVHLQASITHPYTCDLTVRLISPQGTAITVADPTDCSRSAPNLAIDLDSSAPGSPLAPFVGEEAAGEWRLQVVDSVGIDQGSLSGWGLTVQAG
ncbi:MAG TPA: proprotein convertase P-domain-containing protein [Actinomycetospora sp.]|nr:proprotein convertase P-domain-containing protein [Actinomycetospora sp.]